MKDPELQPSIPDDYDRLDSQAMWTTQYAAEGKYPQPTEQDKSEPESQTTKPKQIPVRGHVLTQIADNGRPAEEINTRLKEEGELRRTVTDDERVLGAEQARKWREDHK
jgi:hypothetical protein